MTRDAKLYFIEHQDWKPLIDILDSNKNQNLKNLVAIHGLLSEAGSSHFYAILSISDRCDKIIEEYGGILSAKDDYIIQEVKLNHTQLLYGNKTIASFLKWP